MKLGGLPAAGSEGLEKERVSFSPCSALRTGLAEVWQRFRTSGPLNHLGCGASSEQNQGRAQVSATSVVYNFLNGNGNALN